MNPKSRRLIRWIHILGLSALLAGLEGWAAAPAAAGTLEGLDMVDQCMVCNYPSQDTPLAGYHDDFVSIINVHIGGNVHYIPVWGQCGLYHAPYLF